MDMMKSRKRGTAAESVKKNINHYVYIFTIRKSYVYRMVAVGGTAKDPGWVDSIRYSASVNFGIQKGGATCSTNQCRSLERNHTYTTVAL